MALTRDLRDSMENVTSLSNLNTYKFSSSGHHLNNRDFEVNKGEKFFLFNSTSIIIKGVQTHDELKFYPDNEYVLSGIDKQIFIQGKNLFMNNISYTEDDTKIISGEIYSFSDTSALLKREKAYRRFIHPLGEGKIIFSDFQQMELNYLPNGFSGYVPLIINGQDLYFYSYTFAKEKYLIIDSSFELSVNEFQKICFNILLGFAFIKGDLYHNESFILGFDKKEMVIPVETDYFSMRTSISTNQPTFSTNMMWLNKEKIVYDVDGNMNKDVVDQLYDEIYNFSHSTFSKLSELLLNEEKVQRAVLLYLYGHIATLEIRLPNYFVALEALSSYVVANNVQKTRLNPIKDKKIASKIQEDFIKELTKLKLTNNLTDDEFNIDILTKNIYKLNAPPNADKLSESFTLLKYDLGDERKKILNDRNSFLHGSFVKYVDDDDAFQKALYIALRVQFMIAVLVLKSVGFDGHIINYASFWQNMTNRRVDEDTNVKI